MDLRLFFSTFVLIFLAELGDKTQLVAMARSASGGRMTVFFAASAALVLSTLVAVTLGSLLTRFVPENYIRLAAGLLFIVFGLMILREVLAPRPEVVPAGAAAALGPGAITGFLLDTAAGFEAAAAADYRRLAADCEDSRLRGLLESLAHEEEEHMQRLRQVHGEQGDFGVAPAALAELPLEKLPHDVAEHARPIIAHAVDHERRTAAFYQQLADASHFAALRNLFASLAAAERAHAERLEALAGGDTVA